LPENPLTPDSTAPAAEPIAFSARDGRELAGLLARAGPGQSARGAIVVNGATGVPREFYLKFARYCAERGFHALVYDYRGMGASANAAPRAESARMSDWGSKDMPAAVAWLDRAFPELPVVTVGHSVGGQLIGLMSNHSRASAHVLIAASVGYWGYQHAPFRYLALFFWLIYGPLLLRLRGYVPSGAAWPGLPLPPGVFSEWREWCLSSQHFAPALDSELRENYFREIRAPLLVYAFEDDPIATRRAVAALLKFYPSAAQDVRWISPRTVGLGPIGHQGFFTTRFREALWRPVLDWVEARASAMAQSTMAPPSS
jgi:predicted alpha/beta hydrolase